MIKEEGRWKMGRKIRVWPVKGCKVAYLLVPTKPDFYSLFASSIDIHTTVFCGSRRACGWTSFSLIFPAMFVTIQPSCLHNSCRATDHMTVQHTVYPYLFVALHTGIFKSSFKSGRIQKYYLAWTKFGTIWPLLFTIKSWLGFTSGSTSFRAKCSTLERV